MIEDEKKIQEMAQLGTIDCKGKDCIKCQEEHPHEICWSYRRAKMYYQEGYRKEEEVQKETLQKLFKLINENLFDWGEWWERGLFFAIQPDTIKKIIKEEFGVEVEE